MIKVIMKPEDFKEVERFGEKYALRVLPCVEGDMLSCFETVVNKEPNEADIVAITKDAMKLKAEYDKKDLLIAVNQKVAEIDKYDVSAAVNSFSLYGDEMWLDKATRVGLVNAVNSAKVLGQETVTLGLGGHTYTLPCDTALAMLASLEMYALACYNVTLGHKNAVKELGSIEDVETYDYKTGYPEKLVFE